MILTRRSAVILQVWSSGPASRTSLMIIPNSKGAMSRHCCRPELFLMVEVEGCYEGVVRCEKNRALI